MWSTSSPSVSVSPTIVASVFLRRRLLAVTCCRGGCRTRWTPASAWRRWRRRFGTGTPDIFNTDQGAQFTSAAFTDRVQAAGARCSMDGRGRCLDNVFIERLWRSLKYEAVYLHELSDGFAAERVIAAWMTFYNHVRPHSALGGRTPAEAYGEERAA